MIKWLIRLVLLLVIGLLAYNYFWGDQHEKVQSRAIIDQVKQLGKSISDLLITEKEKFDTGKYNEAANKIGSVVQELKKNAASLNEEELERLDAIEQKHIAFKKQIEQSGQMTAEEVGTKKEELRQQLEELLRETDSFLQNIQ
jgi:DNA anti-recombination protein RmuC